jgi:transposase
MEAGGGAHCRASGTGKLGHAVRLMPASCGRPPVKRNRHDVAEADAIGAAVTRPFMRFVPIRSEDQQSVLLIHRARELLVRQRTQRVNALRGHLAEFGAVAAKGITKMAELLALVADPEDRRVPPLARQVLSLLVEPLRTVDDKVMALKRQLLAWHRTSDTIPLKFGLVSCVWGGALVG